MIWGGLSYPDGESAAAAAPGAGEAGGGAVGVADPGVGALGAAGVAGVAGGGDPQATRRESERREEGTWARAMMSALIGRTREHVNPSALHLPGRC
jgi:hypothetical protein